MTVLTATDVLKCALAAGFDRADANVMTVIAKYESGYDTKSHGDLTLAKNGSLGLWQIFSGAHSLTELGIKAYSDLYDPATNARAARIVFKEQGFTAWSTYNNGHASSDWATLLTKVEAIIIGPPPAPAPSNLLGRNGLAAKGNSNPKARGALVAASNEASHGGPVWKGLCLRFVRTMLEIPSGAPTAIAAWKAVPSKLTHSWYNAPAGVPVFWSGGSTGAGHIAIADGTGKCWSSDILREGHVDLVPITLIAAKWGLHYLGWSEQLNGVNVYTP